MTDTVYTAISFAPVQGFIEKSRKLRDLYGASIILSYLSQKIVEEFHHPPDLEVISPALIHVQEGMPNRILIRGYVERTHVQNTLLKHWQHLLTVCRIWVEENVPADYHWAQKSEQVDQEKGEWERWGSYAWEVFWGKGDSPNAAMKDLETRKLKRDWTAINWMGESSSLSGMDAIAWHRLGDKDLVRRDLKGELTSTDRQELKQELDDFYLRLSEALEEDPSENLPQGKFLRLNERLSIPELAKRLVTRYQGIGEHLGETFKIDSFSEMVRMPEPGQSGHWTGWFMGDGDKVGDHLKGLAAETELKEFSQAMRKWGKDFKKNFDKDLGRVVYAGGDDFMGVIYSDKPHSPISKSKALDWLTKLNSQWKTHGQPINLSVGFVWAGHSVPQRDVLQHCREAEKRAKSLGRDRVTIRVLFNSGQYVQWTCPWDYLDILTKYHDRNHRDQVTPAGDQNWNHLYSDWEALKARHAIQLKLLKKGREVNEDAAGLDVAIELFNLYFAKEGDRIESERLWEHLVNEADGHVVTNYEKVNWLNDLVQVGWQLCRNSSL